MAILNAIEAFLKLTNIVQLEAKLEDEGSYTTGCANHCDTLDVQDTQVGLRLHQTVDRLDVTNRGQKSDWKHGSRYLDHLGNEGLCHEVCGFLAIGSKKLIIVDDVCQNGIIEELGTKWNSVQGRHHEQRHRL